MIWVLVHSRPYLQNVFLEELIAAMLSTQHYN